MAAVSTYEQAGVSLGKAEQVVGRLRAAVDSTRTPGVAAALGGFAGLFALDGDRLLAASTDGVGTKLVLARRAGRLHDAGADLAAHCINDVVTTGAQPLFFLDYVAGQRLELDEIAALVEGAADVCRRAGCAILGGETAEMPGVYQDDELDFAGTCVGLVERTRLVDGSRVGAGDAVLGLASTGLHANGFTLVRALLARRGEEGPPSDVDLLAPTRCYLDDVRHLRERCDVRALAHVTGGGIPGNLTRVLPPGLGAVIDPTSWERPPVFAWLAAQDVPEDEQRRVFNLGIGYCAVVPAVEAARSGLPVIGRVEEGVDGVVFSSP
jgi:phosphoribosylformylglycinamidine cyclo-ligase